MRGIELSLLQRCAAHVASKTDIEESFSAGKAAVENAVNGVTDKMVGFERTVENGQYKCNIKLFELSDVANTEKKVPLEWINETGDGLKQEYIDYALPPHPGPDRSQDRRRPAALREPQKGQGIKQSFARRPAKSDRAADFLLSDGRPPA